MKAQELYISARFRNQANVEWDDRTFYCASKYLLSNLRSLKICRNCFCLYGPIQLQDGHFVTQKCSCDTPRNDTQWHVNGHGYNFYKDFNQEYEICYCCGLEVIPSGSRWSSFYCRDCKSKIRKLNEMVARCIIPYGRHSLMNDVSLSGKECKDTGAIDRFVVAVNTMNQEIDIVEKHRKAIVKKWGELLQLADDDTAVDLILKSESVELVEWKKESFIELLALTFGRTVDEARIFHEDCLSR